MSARYRFATAAQWTAGWMDGFDLAEDALRAIPPLEASRIARVANIRFAADGGCGAVRVLTGDGRILTHRSLGWEDDGAISGGEEATGFAAGPLWLWLARGEALSRYDVSTLQPVGGPSLAGLLAIAADGDDGLWTARHADSGMVLDHFDCFGRIAGGSVRIDGARPAHASLAIERATGRIAVASADSQFARLIIVDPRGVDEPLERELPAAPRYFVAGAASGEFLIAAVHGQLLRYSSAGALRSDDAFPFAETALPVGGVVAAGGQTILAARDGLYAIGPAAGGTGAVRRSVYITPTLIAPETAGAPWKRADVEALIPQGAHLRIDVATASSSTVADVAAMAARALTPASQAAKIEAALRWHAGHSRSYRGDGTPQRLHFLLDGLPERRLWLRLEVIAPTGSEATELFELEVLRGGQSWLDELPEIYKFDNEPAAQLNRFLAPLEALFDDINSRIAGLPATIAPRTAPPDRHDFLLSWLGFPQLRELPAERKRGLLEFGAQIMAKRGTVAALCKMLEIVTGGSVRIDDDGEHDPFWVLGAGGGAVRGQPLGRSSRIVSGLRSAFRAGAARAGEAPLADAMCIDIAALARARRGTVKIRIAVSEEGRAWLKPMVARLLELFVPAHCAIDLRFVPLGTLEATGLLNGDAAVAEDCARLGQPLRPGSWRLPRRRAAVLELGKHTKIESEPRLA